VSAPLIALSGVTLAAAASATLSINAAALDLGSLSGTGRSVLGVCTADRPVGCDTRRRTGRSVLGVCTADRPVGCDARRRSCVGNALEQCYCSRSRKLGRDGPLDARCLCCSVSAPPIALSGMTIAAAAASATLSIKAAALAPGSSGGTGCSLLGMCPADRPVGCHARRRSCVATALDQRCCSRSRKLELHKPLPARYLPR
jgi:hypothetical protein